MPITACQLWLLGMKTNNMDIAHKLHTTVHRYELSNIRVLIYKRSVIQINWASYILISYFVIIVRMMKYSIHNMYLALHALCSRAWEQLTIKFYSFVSKTLALWHSKINVIGKLCNIMKSVMLKWCYRLVLKWIVNFTIWIVGTKSFLQNNLS